MHHWHSHRSIRWPLEETVPFRTEIFHYWIKGHQLINIILICSNPSKRTRRPNPRQQKANTINNKLYLPSGVKCEGVRNLSQYMSTAVNTGKPCVQLWEQGGYKVMSVENKIQLPECTKSVKFKVFQSCYLPNLCALVLAQHESLLLWDSTATKAAGWLLHITVYNATVG